jgi:Cu(I)/Ag(I) efflux system membrane fusion protein
MANRWLVLLGVVALLLGAFLLGRLTTPAAPHHALPSASSAQRTLWTCGMHPEVLREEPGLCPICGMQLTPLDSGAGIPDGVLIDPVVEQNMGLRTALVRFAPLARSLRAFGRLVEPEPNHHEVNLRVSGWIRTLHAATDGQRVARGEPLFELFSPELTSAIGELIAATRAQDQALAEASARRLERLGLESDDVRRFAALDAAPERVTFRSPVDGHVVDIDVYAGSAVEAGMRVMRIADPSTLWLELRVFERDLADVELGARVQAEVDAWPASSREGRVVFVHPHLDEASRTALVRVELPNPELELREGMYARARIELAQGAEVLVVPREAVIDTGERQIVFLRAERGRFVAREVRMGRRGDGGLVEILHGLAEGETVVTSGQFLLDAESRTRAAIQRYLGGKDEPDPLGVTPAWSAAVDAFAAEYLRWSASLGAPQESSAPLDAAALIERARALASAAPDDEAARRAHALEERAGALSAGPIESQREAFRALSLSTIELVRRTPPAQAVAERLFLLHCPMTDGRWLQTDEAVRNPYYATEMKACGLVEEELVRGGSR